ncbi:restriction endonuclease subunit S [Vibrio cincinnatiensis]|uniref:restriction endonuclease subunit S n=1 Tax=Vibrio cincinnatiensis TaxID=675 RepID=UPI0012ACD92B|nr:restriction endonuclease subunit S [Vibrio cincinnatiensis]
MKLVSELFSFETGNLPALELTDSGDIPLVYGTMFNNGVETFVEVTNNEDIFYPPLITVSYLGTAFVQVLPFTTSVVDKSNIIVLRPKLEMGLSELYFYAYQINKHAKFGFSYGRRMNMARLNKLYLQEFSEKYSFDVDFSKYLISPDFSNYKKITTGEFTNIKNIFDVVNAKSKGFDSYFEGDIAFVSNGYRNKGILGYVTPLDDDKQFPASTITISAFCEAIVQEQKYIARGNGGSGLTVLIPKKDMNLTQLNFYAAYINKYIKWRFSYGRMVTIARFNKIELPIIF